jgi:hypothetical protein
MGLSVLAARKAAARELTDSWPAAVKFPVEGPADHRAKVLQELTSQFRSQFSSVREGGLDAISARQPPSRQVSQESLAKVESLLATNDVQGLIAYGPELIDVLDALRFQRNQILPETVYRNVLPKLQPVFAVLDRFSSQEAAERRRAATKLQELAAKHPCGRLALDRLSQLMASESDDLVWQSVLQTVANENGEEIASMAYAGLGHSSSEVRRRACEYLAAHPDRNHAKMLIPALDDSQPLVVCAAVEALAAGGMDDPSPLRNLLGSNNEEIQLSAAKALAQLNNASGKPALERLAYSNDPLIRAKVAAAMGEYPDPSFIPILIRFLNDQASVSRTALASLPLVQGEDISQLPGQPPAKITERISRWKRWYEQR